MKVFLFTSLLFLGLLPDTGAVLHDFHLSKCDIVYSAEEKALQVSLQLFIDDLELALGAVGHENLGICTNKEKDEAESIIHDYVTNHLSLSIDNGPVELLWVGKEVSDDLAGIWCYLEVYLEEPKSSIEVHNDLLVEVFKDQRNIVKLTYKPDQKAYFLFDQKEIEGTLNISE